MRALLLKELRLAVHPSTYLMVLLGALALIPSWMYGAIFIYGILAAFFNGMNAREMRDLDYTFALPVSRASMVRARVSVMVMVEAATLSVIVLCIALRGPLGIDAVAAAQGPVGTGANLYLVGFGFVVFGVFNVVFYPLYYRDPRKVGIPFLVASIPAAVAIFAAEALPYLPVAGLAALGVPGLSGIGCQLAVLGAGALAFALLTLLGAGLAVRAFSTFDA